MPFGLLADAVVVVHALFVCFVVLGGLLVLRWPKLAWVHVPAAIWGAAIEFVGFICPLTPLEQALRRRGGEAGYRGGFVEHYVVSVLYPTGLTREIQLALGFGVVTINGVIYWRLATRGRRRGNGDVRNGDTGMATAKGELRKGELRKGELRKGELRKGELRKGELREE